MIIVHYFQIQRKKRNCSFYHSFTVKSPLRKVNEKLDISDKRTLYLPIYFKGYDYNNSNWLEKRLC